MSFFSNKSRPYHFGPYPLERLQRDPTLASVELSLAPLARPADKAADRSWDGPIAPLTAAELKQR